MHVQQDKYELIRAKDLKMRTKTTLSSICFTFWSALATAPAETSAEAKEAFNFNNSSSSFFSFY
jgi:hypothetical protein